MSRTSYTRRQVCQIGLSSLAGLSLLDLATACGSSTGSGDAITMQMSFWGDASRNKLTQNAFSAYHSAHSQVTIKSWFTDFNSYFNKLNTQIAGNSIPDLIQMDMAYLVQYVDQNHLMDLSSLVADKTIDLSDFDADLLENSRYKNTTYGIPMGGNYECMVYDTDIIQQAGVGNPPANWTWDDFATYTTTITNALKAKSIIGTTDSSGAIDVFEIWVRQHGHELYTTDGKVGFTNDDAASWFDYWSKLRKAGGCASAELQATITSSGPSASLLAKGKAAFAIAHSNQFGGYQLLSQHKFALNLLPNGPQIGLYHKPSMLLCIATKSKYTKDAANFTNFLITDPAGVKAIGTDRGIPGSARARTALQAVMKDADNAILAYETQIATNKLSTPKTVLDPASAGKVQKALQSVAQSVSFNKMSVTDGAKALVEQSQQALA